MLPLLEYFITAVLSLLAVLASLIYWYYTNTTDHWKKKGVPYAPPTFFFGNMKEVMRMKQTFAHGHQELYNRFEGHRYAGIFQSRNPTLLLRDPELIKTFLVKDFQHFHDRDIIVNTETNPLLQHLFILPGHRWRVLRYKLSPTFTSGRMKNMYSLMDDCSVKLTSYLQEYADRTDVVEIKEILAKFTTDIIGTCAFGLKMNAMNDPDSEFRRMGRKVFEPSWRRRIGLFATQILPHLAKTLKFTVLEKDISDFFIGVVKETVDYRLKNNVKRNDFLQLLMNLRYKGKIDDGDEKEPEENVPPEKNKLALDFEFDDGLMAAQAFVFFIAGFETSSSTMSFAMHCLAVNPDIQAKLREEIDATLEENGGKFTYESIMSMKYLDKVVSETLRMYGPVPFLTRRTTIPYTIPGTDVHLDNGTSIIVPVFALHMDPKYYPDPERFDPERWTDEEKAKRHNYTYLPFGEGPRNCIGMRFGLLQTKLGLATLLSKYEFHVCERTQIPLEFDPKVLILSAKSGIFVRITNRRDPIPKDH